MYFWRIERLKRDLARQPLSARAALGYVLAILLILAVGVEVTALWPPEEYAAHDAVLAIGNALLMVAGTYGAYRANGNATGPDFIARYVAITWVVGIRLTVFGVPIMLAAVVVLGVVLAVASPASLDSDMLWGWTATAFVLAWNAWFYVRVIHHIRALASASVDFAGGPAALASTSSAG
jgi:hypothetical protein